MRGVERRMVVCPASDAREQGFHQQSGPTPETEDSFDKELIVNMRRGTH